MNIELHLFKLHAESVNSVECIMRKYVASLFLGSQMGKANATFYLFSCQAFNNGNIKLSYENYLSIMKKIVVGFIEIDV